MSSPSTPLSEHDLDYGPTLRGLREGLKVFERYTLVRQLGRGGMGVVWLAQDEKLDLEMALKFLPENLVHDEIALDDLRRETKRCMKLTHQHIVHVYDFVTDDAIAAIAMEFVDGKSLSALRLEQPQRVFEVARLAPMVRQVCEALTYAHEQGRLVHYDLKPGNLMLTSGGLVKVMDFGIAASINDSNSRQSRARSTAGMGTLHYMSPQQLAGYPPAVSDDVYSLGATIYELLTGRPPFHGFRDRALEEQIQTAVPPSLMQRRAELAAEGAAIIPPLWEQVVGACLEKEPARRPQSVAEVWQRLGGGSVGQLSSQSVAAKSSERNAATSVRHDSSNKKMILSAIAALICIGVGLWWVDIESPGSQREPVTLPPEEKGVPLSSFPAFEGMRWAQSCRGYQDWPTPSNTEDAIRLEMQADGTMVLNEEIMEWTPLFETISRYWNEATIRNSRLSLEIHPDPQVGRQQMERAVQAIIDAKVPADQIWISLQVPVVGDPAIRAIGVGKNKVGLLWETTGTAPSTPAHQTSPAHTLRELKAPDWALARKNALSTSSALPLKTVRASSATKDSPFINSLGMKFVPVPIGAGPSKNQRILFSIWETRSKDYAAFVKDSGHDAGEDWKTYSYNGEPVGRGEGEKAEESSHPVANVSHDDAVFFCAWLTKKDRASLLISLRDEYRLPSDVEWSYAVGIGDREDVDASAKEKFTDLKDVYPWGATYPPPMGSGNYADMTALSKATDNGLGTIEGYTDGHATTAPVGSFKANQLGLYDMGGNVCERTSSPWQEVGTDLVSRGGGLDWHRQVPGCFVVAHVWQPWCAQLRGGLPLCFGGGWQLGSYS